MAFPFSKPGGRLKSYDILLWAAPIGPFILKSVFEQFSDRLGTGKDKGGQSLAQKDASERLRKLLKSGMIMVVAATSLKALTLQHDVVVEKGDGQSETVTVEALITQKQEQEYSARIAELSVSSGAGRKPRVYLVTRKGLEYVKFRESAPTGPEPERPSEGD